MESTTAYPPRQRIKLTGRVFYDSIGSPKMILAPMVSQSEFAWRLLTRSFMTPGSSTDLLAYTPMLHARMFVETTKFRDHHFQPTRKGLADLPFNPDPLTSDLYLDGNPGFDRPLIVQFCANDPEELLQAAKYVQPYCDAVDLNLGCPQGIARSGHYGAFLQEDWDLVYKLINTLHNNLDIPVTAKIRILETKERTLEYARTIISAGASILTIHGRQRDQKGHNTGLADWSVVRYLRENLPIDTVIFANGNILQHEDTYRCLEETGADGVMSAEGNLHDPTIFAKPPTVPSECREYWKGRDGKEGYRMDAVFRRYMDILYRYVLEKPPPHREPLFLPSDPSMQPIVNSLEQEQNKDEDGRPPAKKQKTTKKRSKPTSPSLLSVQAHLFHLLRPLVAQHTDIRDALAHCHAGDIPAFENVLSLVEKVVRQGLLDYECHPENYEDVVGAGNDNIRSDGAERTDFESSLAAVNACRRPWWVCQPYVRPLPKEALEKGSLTLGRKDRRRLDGEGVRDVVEKPDEVVERINGDGAKGMVKTGVEKEATVCG